MTPITIPFSELQFSFSRSSGPGGQNVNKVNSKVTMEWNIVQSESITPSHKERFKEAYKNLINEEGIFRLTVQQNRSQKANIDECIHKLHGMLEKVRFPPKIRRPTKPKRSAVLKRLDSKKKDSEKKRMRKSDY